MIRPFSELTKSQQLEVREIFELTSNRVEFDSDHLKDEHRFNYLDYYSQKKSGLFLVFMKNEKAVAYICGESETMESILLNKISYLEFFKEQYKKFPVSLHTNCHPAFQGQGLGSELMQAFESLVKSKGYTGIHLITSPSARNVNFYKRAGFDAEFIQKVGNCNLLLLGKMLNV